MPDYQFIVDFISRFDDKGLESFIKQTEKAGMSVKNLQKQTEKQSKATGKSTGRHRRFRMELLGIMFAGQRIARHFEDMIKPAEDLIGLHEMEAALLAEKFLPLAEEQIEALDKEWDRWNSLTEAQKESERQAAKWGKAIGEAMDTGASAGLLFWSATEFIRKMPGDFKTAKEAIGTFATKVKDFDWSDFKTNIMDKLELIPGKFEALPGWAQAGITIGAAIGAAVGAYFLGTWMIDMWAKAIGEPLARVLLGVVGGVMVAAAIALAAAVGWTGIGAVAAAALGAAGAGLIAAAATYTPPELQYGGIVTRPTTALIGEHGAEAVIPLAKLGGLGATYYITMSIHTTSSLSREEIPALVREVGERFGDQLREIRMGRML